MRNLLRIVLLGFISVGVESTGAAPFQYYEAQPWTKRSTLVTADEDRITDIQFAQMAKGLLLKNNGQSNVRGASFLFAQCFSGGMFNDLDSAFGDEVRWVGGSAARWDEPSWGMSNGHPFPLDYWVKALILPLSWPNPPLDVPMIEAVNGARAFDEVGPNGTGDENPQSLYRNGGETINHRVNGANQHNAILWAGKANGKRHVNDIKVMYENLSTAFQATGDPWKIIVLGDSDDLGLDALPATKANLQFAFDTLQPFQDEDANFLFFSSNHGGSQTVVLPDPALIGSDSRWAGEASLVLGEVQGILGTPDAAAGLVLRFDNLTGPGVRVLLDGIDVGDPFLKRDRFGDSLLCVDADILRRIGLDFEIEVVNNTRADLTLLEAYFSTGAIDNQIVDLPPELIGDANDDCSVGAADYAIWAAQFGQTVPPVLSADFDLNGSVGAGDYALWAANFGKTCRTASVPEPTGLVLALTGCVAIWGLRRRR